MNRMGGWAVWVGMVAVMVWGTRGVARCAEVRVPAFTAYALPEPESIRFSEPAGVTRWRDPVSSVNWYGYFTNAGTLNVRVEARLPDGGVEKLRMIVGEVGRDVEIRRPSGESAAIVTADFGRFEIPRPGHQRLCLESLAKRGPVLVEPETLVLEGPAAEGAHFNLKERRNAASVHLSYPTSTNTSLAAFYCEVTALEDPTSSFYMACGWHRGYFGMQVNSKTERRIIFSVWDSGNEAVDRSKVAATNRVMLVGKGEGVYTGDFGNEGTGGHSHLKYPWKTGTVQRFLVTATPTNSTDTIFSGHWLHPETESWMLISAWQAPKEGGWLKRPHSFSENFWGSNGHLRRKALYGNQWVRSSDGQWTELTVATFSHDPTGKTDRKDRSMGIEAGQFYLSHGGFGDEWTAYRKRFERPAAGNMPGALKLFLGAQ